jgi:bifunctional non-homologous end joining protein LigD
VAQAQAKLRITKASSVRAADAASHHALIGGWVQEKGSFTALLLGVREGRRRRLTFLGRAEVDPRGLLMRLLESRLRELEIESSPFLEQVPPQAGETLHWIKPELVADLEAETPARGTWKRAQLKTVLERGPIRHPRWLAPPRAARL